jgi:hypothetical protein
VRAHASGGSGSGIRGLAEEITEQVGKNLVIMVGRVAVFGYHGGDSGWRRLGV